MEQPTEIKKNNITTKFQCHAGPSDILRYVRFVNLKLIYTE